jgi:phage regulator Rha-like protein
VRFFVRRFNFVKQQTATKTSTNSAQEKRNKRIALSIAAVLFY